MKERKWWGNIQLEGDACVRLQLGPLKLVARHLAKEWHISYQADTALMAEEDVICRADTLSHAEDNVEYDNISRHVFAQPGDTLIVRPALADRPVVVRPYVPFYLPPGEVVTLFVSSPLWLSLSVDSQATPLVELPIQRASDTWFGPNTMVGELCYASRTQGRTCLKELPIRPHRAITPVIILNHASKPLLLERLNIMVPYLTLYENDIGDLYTSRVTLTREHDGDNASMLIDKTAPDELGFNCHLLTPARSKGDSGALSRAFDALFG